MITPPFSINGATIFWKQRVPLTSKVLLVISAVGLILWMVQDRLQDRWAESLFASHYATTLEQQFQTGLTQLETVLLRQKQAVKLYVQRDGFRTYLEERQSEHSTKPATVIIHALPPPWLPSPSILRSFSRSAYFLLLDDQNRIQELFGSGRHPPRATQFEDHFFDYTREGGPTSITEINGFPHFISSSALRNEKGRLLGSLVIVIPFDSHFLIDFHRRFDLPGIQVFINSETQTIMASSDPPIVAVGTPMNTLNRDYLIVGQDFFNYEFSSEMIFRVATVVPRASLQTLQRNIIKQGREQKSVSFLVFVGAFFLVMFWLSRKLNRLTGQIERFSEDNLGVHLDRPVGDALYGLDELLQRFTDEISRSKRHLTEELRERRIIESRLRRGQARYRNLVENTTDWVWELDDQGRFSYSSPRIFELLGYRPEEVRGHPPYTFMNAAEAHRVEQYFSTAFLALQPLETFTSSLIHKNGQQVILETNGAPFFDKNNHFLGYHGISRNITAQRKLQESIREIKNRLEIDERKRLGNLLHEGLGQSLQAIKLGLEMKQGSAGAAEEIMELKEAIEQLRDVTTILRPLFLERMDLDEAVQWWCQRQARNTTGQIKIQTQGDFSNLGQEAKYNLFRIIQESLTNALKHAEAKKIVISLRRECHGTLYMRISDNGRGMVLAESERRSKGLGLSIIREQAERLGGRAHFETSPNTGLTLTVEIPA
ncbi:MAG: PAS domain S-box protein [Magnetococcales bacterium]|nr:PAS domain S-box protein [Magnetococcales bacterium]